MSERYKSPPFKKERLLSRRDVLIIAVAGALGGASGYAGGLLGIELGKREFFERIEEVNKTLSVHERAILNQMRVNQRQDKENGK